MPRELEPSLNEAAFVAQALQEGLRLDGRGNDDYRPITVTLGEEYGVADVRIGKTRYDCLGRTPPKARRRRCF